NLAHGVDRSVTDRAANDEVARRVFFLEPERHALGGERARGNLDGAAHHLVDRGRGRQLAARVEQRVRQLGRLLLLPVQPRLLQRDRRLEREGGKQAHLALRHALRVLLGDRDPAGDAVARQQRRDDRVLATERLTVLDDEILDALTCEQRVVRVVDAVRGRT